MTCVLVGFVVAFFLFFLSVCIFEIVGGGRWVVLPSSVPVTFCFLRFPCVFLSLVANIVDSPMIHVLGCGARLNTAGLATQKGESS